MEKSNWEMYLDPDPLCKLELITPSSESRDINYYEISEEIEEIFEQLDDPAFIFAWGGTTMRLSSRYNLPAFVEDILDIYQWIRSAKKEEEFLLTEQGFHVEFKMSREENEIINVSANWIDAYRYDTDKLMSELTLQSKDFEIMLLRLLQTLEKLLATRRLTFEPLSKMILDSRLITSST